MKKLLLASAVAALSVSAAQANITSKDGPVEVYGKAFVTVDASSTKEEVNGKKSDTKTRPALSSNFSRIGFRGEEPLTSDIGLVYQLEYGVDVTDSSNPQFNARDSFLGLSSSQLGTLKAGILTAVDGEVDFANRTTGGVVGGGNVLASFDAPRADNAFAYVSPDFDGAQVLAMYALDEDTTGSEVAGVAGKYAPEGQPFRAGASYIHVASSERAAKATLLPVPKDIFRISGEYDINEGITVGALYQLTDFNTDDKENALTVSGEMKTATPWAAYAQGDVVTNALGNKDSERYRVAVGGKYEFNTHTIGHVYGAVLQDEDKNAKDKTTQLGIGGGLEYKF